MLYFINPFFTDLNWFTDFILDIGIIELLIFYLSKHIITYNFIYCILLLVLLLIFILIYSGIIKSKKTLNYISSNYFIIILYILLFIIIAFIYEYPDYYPKYIKNKWAILGIFKGPQKSFSSFIIYISIIIIIKILLELFKITLPEEFAIFTEFVFYNYNLFYIISIIWFSGWLVIYLIEMFIFLTIDFSNKSINYDNYPKFIQNWLNYIKLSQQVDKNNSIYFFYFMISVCLGGILILTFLLLS